MVCFKLLKVGKDLQTDEYFAVIHVSYEGHPMGGDGDIMILDCNDTTYCNGRLTKSTGSKT